MTAAPVMDEDYNPFTEEDLKKLLEEEKACSREEGWKFVRKTDTCEVWKKHDDDHPVHLFKAFLSFPGIPPDKIVEMIYDLDVRRKWEKHFPVIDEIETHKHYKVVYWLCKMPPAVTDRDIVQDVGIRRDEATNSTFIMYKNASHPKHPEKKGVIRAEAIMSGVIIRPDPDDAGSTKMTVFLQNDMKGLIPHVIMDAFASHEPCHWHSHLSEYYHKQHPKSEGEKK